MMEIVNFEKEVLQRSHDIPVVVDFWAPWCGPCQVLGPVIEKLANEAAEKWELIKVNTEENQETAANNNIRGIPAVKMFHKGKMIAEFTGALPKQQIENWLQEYLPDELKEELASIKSQLFNVGHKEAVMQLHSFVNANPTNEEAQVWLRASTIGNQLNIQQGELKRNPKFIELYESISDLTDLLGCQEEAPSNLSEKLDQARQSIRNFDYEVAVQSLIEATLLNKNFSNELPRRASVALFKLMGSDHPITKKYRRQFDMSLY